MTVEQIKSTIANDLISPDEYALLAFLIGRATPSEISEAIFNTSKSVIDLYVIAQIVCGDYFRHRQNAEEKARSIEQFKKDEAKRKRKESATRRKENLTKILASA